MLLILYLSLYRCLFDRVIRLLLSEPGMRMASSPYFRLGRRRVYFPCHLINWIREGLPNDYEAISICIICVIVT